MNPGDEAYVELIAVQFGKPAAGQKIKLAFNNDNVLQAAPVSAVPPPQSPLPAAPTPMVPVGTPAAALKFKDSVTTGKDGRARFKLTASDPGNPRKFIDGQVYAVAFTWDEDNDQAFPPDSNGALSVLVFDTFKGKPTWDVCAEGMRELHAHVAQPAESDDAYFFLPLVTPQ
jgi:hypothetical protein